MKDKIQIPDSLRAFAALPVCLFHFVCTTTGYVTTGPVLSVFSPGKYGVQLFFVISGFVIPWSMHAASFRFRNFFKFFFKRLARLEPPCVVLVAITMAFSWIMYIFIEWPSKRFSSSIRYSAS